MGDSVGGLEEVPPASSGPGRTLKWTTRVEEAYEAALEQVGGLEAAKPKSVLDQMRGEFPSLTLQSVKWKLLAHRRRVERHRVMEPAGITPPTKWAGRLEEVYEAAVARLGGLQAARPKALLEALLPEFPSMTLQVVKGHVQKQRRRVQRQQQPEGSGSADGGAQATPPHGSPSVAAAMAAAASAGAAGGSATTASSMQVDSFGVGAVSAVQQLIEEPSEGQLRLPQQQQQQQQPHMPRPQRHRQQPQQQQQQPGDEPQRQQPSLLPEPQRHALPLAAPPWQPYLPPAAQRAAARASRAALLCRQMVVLLQQNEERLARLLQALEQRQRREAALSGLAGLGTSGGGGGSSLSSVVAELTPDLQRVLEWLLPRGMAAAAASRCDSSGSGSGSGGGVGSGPALPLRPRPLPARASRQQRNLAEIAGSFTLLPQHTVPPQGSRHDAATCAAPACPVCAYERRLQRSREQRDVAPLPPDARSPQQQQHHQGTGGTSSGIPRILPVAGPPTRVLAELLQIPQALMQPPPH